MLKRMIGSLSQNPAFSLLLVTYISRLRISSQTVYIESIEIVTKLNVLNQLPVTPRCNNSSKLLILFFYITI